jgi:membrane associated rhomboid family serine protease
LPRLYHSAGRAAEAYVRGRAPAGVPRGDALFPLRDDNPTLLTPFFTVTLIVGNVLAWVYLQGAGLSEGALVGSVCMFGIIPAELTGLTGDVRAVELAPGLPPCLLDEGTYGTLATAMFMHGSWLHLLSNMWFLWLFGNNIEDSMGHVRYLAFYLLTGLAASAAHIYSDPASMVPMVGASGAVSGLMGAYLVLYPRVRIKTLFLIVFIVRIIPVPAWVVLLFWFGLQLLSGYTTPGIGVAFWAHVGGFVAGVVLVKLFENRTLVEARRQAVGTGPGELEGRGLR